MGLSFRGLVVAFVMLCGIACAQPAGTRAEGLSLDAILMRLQIHQWEYERNVPDFFADEWVVSEMHGMHTPQVQTITDSVFRLRRGDRKTFPPVLIETRTVLSTNSVEAKDGQLNGPSVLIGAFSNGLAMVTLQQRICFNFRMTHHRDVHHVPTFAIEYELKPQAVGIPGCLPWPGTRGEAIIDANTFDTLNFQMYVPRYPVVPDIQGPWRWSVEYAPVILDGHRYSMPKKIVSESESMDGAFVWTFRAGYRNYHKTGVHTRIITNLDGQTESAGRSSVKDSQPSAP